MSRWWRTSGLVCRELELDGLVRRYWLGPPAGEPRPLLVALHGLGMTGRNLEAITGIATRGAERAAAVVLPDAWQQVWDVPRAGPSGRPVDDGAFLRAVVAQLRGDGVADADAPFLAGISNGALMAERAARERLVDVRGIALVAGTTRTSVRSATPTPRQPAEVVLVGGTADPAMPYEGGAIRSSGALGRTLARRARAAGDDPARRIVAGVEAVARDWVGANGLEDAPVDDAYVAERGGIVVTRRRWAAPARPSVTVYRVEGGGHAWPGGPRLLPRWLIGRVARGLDATDVVLRAAEASLDRST